MQFILNCDLKGMKNTLINNELRELAINLTNPQNVSGRGTEYARFKEEFKR